LGEQTAQHYPDGPAAVPSAAAPSLHAAMPVAAYAASQLVPSKWRTSTDATVPGCGGRGAREIAGGGQEG
jgi:hypothetical protein